MGEYADEYLRQEIKTKFGFDIDDLARAELDSGKSQCAICKRWFKGLQDHMRDAHKDKREKMK
jgi:hypothetical protein